MIEHLVVIGGASGAGKSTLATRLVSNQLPEINKRLNIVTFDGWQRETRDSLAKKCTLGTGRELVFECNILDMLSSGRQSDVLPAAREISFVTLWTPLKRLKRQLLQRDLRRPQRTTLPIRVALRIGRFVVIQLIGVRLTSEMLRRIPRKLGGMLLGNPYTYGRLRERLEVYEDPVELARYYNHWLQYCQQYRATTRTHLIVEFDEVLRFHIREPWKNMAQISPCDDENQPSAVPS